MPKLWLRGAGTWTGFNSDSDDYDNEYTLAEHAGPVYYDPSRNKLVQVRGREEDNLLCGGFVVFLDDARTNIESQSLPQKSLEGWIEVTDPASMGQLVETKYGWRARERGEDP